MKLVWLLVPVVVIACSSTSSSTPVDGGTDAAPQPWVCPTTKPAVGAACAGVGLSCEYGTHRVPECNVRMVCTGTQFQEIKASCETQFGCPDTPPVDGTQCGGPQVSCYYGPGNDACRCDAVWHCASTPIKDPKCPTVRPLQGTPCPKASWGLLTCDYGCIVTEELFLTCDTTGIWQPGSCTLN